MYYIIAPIILSLIIAILLGKILIPFLKSKKLGQKILDIGPRWHKSKEGTPVMGGLLFIFGSLASLLIFGLNIKSNDNSDYGVFLCFALAFACGLIGFIDDYAKLIKKQNEGLSVVQKFALQFPAAIIFVVILKYMGMLNSLMWVPFINIYFEFGSIYYAIIVLGMVYIMNSVNFTDGIDGLCGTVTAIVSVMFIIIFYIAGNNSGLVLASGLLGGLIGFLYFNFYPAKVFMGDTGSLFLGGIVSALAIWQDMAILLFLFGIIYVFESLSVMLQVASFKLTGKRIFKMSPVHHHFEMCGWSEIKIVGAASAVTVIVCGLSILAVYWR